LNECTPAGDYYVRAIEQVAVQVNVSAGEIPYSKAGATLAQSSSFHYNGSPKQSVCDAVSQQQAQGTNAPIVIGVGSLLTTAENPIYIVGTATINTVSIKITNGSGAVMLQGDNLPVSNNRWRYSPSQSLPMGTYTVSVSGAGTTVTGSLKVTAGTPTCTLTTSKPTYKLGETVTLSWTSQNATYVSFDQGGSDLHNLPSGKLSASGSQTITVSDNIGPTYALLRAYSDSGEGYCRSNFEISYQ
jgi:hypothetical protein